MTLTRRARLALAGLAFVVGMVGMVVLLTAEDTDRPVVAPAPSPQIVQSGPTPLATATGPFAAGPVPPPPTGAYLGAWVRPASLTQAGREAAVTKWEQTLGRRLDIVNTYRRLEEEFFTESDLEFTGRGSTLMLSWTGGDTRMTTMGRLDAKIKERAREVKKFGKPVLLRYRWEMDRPGLKASMWSPADFVAAWKYVRKIFKEVGATNASWVWCPTIEGFAGGYAPPFYPGDDQVDWVCADVYAGKKLVSFEDLMRPLLTWARAHPAKPIMIGEFGVARAWGSEARAAWLREVPAVVKANPQIRAAVTFESDPIENDGATQQFQVSDDPLALAAFKGLAGDPHFNPVAG